MVQNPNAFTSGFIPCISPNRTDVIISGEKRFLNSTVNPCIRYPLKRISSKAAWNGISNTEIRIRGIRVALLLLSEKFEGSALRQPNRYIADIITPVSYTHLRAHETVLDLVCR